MFFNGKISLMAALSIGVAALCSCTTDMADMAAPSVAEESPKVAGTTEGAEAGVLIVRFSEDAVAMLERHAEHAAATRSAITRSGIEDVDCIFDRLDVTSFRRVFPEGKYEDDTRAAGLHRWYLLRFSPDANLDEAAAALAAVAEVSTVQCSRRVCRTFDNEVYPMPAEAAAQPTRAMVTADFNDPQLRFQWHYINNGDIAVSETAVAGADINVAEAWKYTGGDPRVIVAVVDSGVKHTHPDLAANMWINTAELYGEPGVDDDGNGFVDDVYGYNFVQDSGTITWDREGDASHGTHVAGTVAAVNNNGVGVCGIAGGTGHNDGARIMSCQIFDGMEDSSDYQTALAIKYAADNGASILQCSYGLTMNFFTDNIFAEWDPLTLDALLYFQKYGGKACDAIDGGLVIYAAGNNGDNFSSYPGAYRTIISVTALAADFLPAYYTNYHLGCNIAAPGGEIVSGNVFSGVLSTVCSELDANEEDYGYIQGTSMACPHVSGVAALGLSYALKRGKHFTQEEFSNMLLTSVNDIDKYMVGYKTMYGKTMNLEADYRGEMGTGSIDAYRLLMQVEGTPCITIAPGKDELVPLTDHFGGGAENLTFVPGGIDSSATDLERFGAEMSAEDMERLGVEEKPRIVDGRLQIKCTKSGCAKIRIRAIAGGNRLGAGSVMGGMPVVKEIAVVARDSESNRWL